ncbi:DUF4153 domain-containing protein [Neobacillus sp. LXY-1]|uniref:DUF4153 domain-containing protein n=1 Tax=Neobacillus sp. LXY-1 TaxID=3379133 RepID=UPI003EE3A6C6
MVQKIEKSDWVFLVFCLILGILAEEAFFRGQIGISYLVFILAFYAVLFYRSKSFVFSHQRLGYLILCCIWLLSASYVLNDSMLFYVLNILFIPALVIFHLVLVTGPKNLKWNQMSFMALIFSRILNAIKYDVSFTKQIGKGFKGDVDHQKFIVGKKIALGVVIAFPLMLVVMRLLMMADTQFELLIGGIPNWFNMLDGEVVFRSVVIFLFTIAFFGFLQVLFKKQVTVLKQSEVTVIKLDSIITITVLIIMNVVYVLFTVVQFKYFFGGSLDQDFTYAEYARKGFFELLFVTIINLSITVMVLWLGKQEDGFLKRLTQTLLTLIVVSSAVMLCSAFIRLSLYEDAYGYTLTRVLAHSFMIFLGLIFMYTLVKIWMEKLSLFHFYFVASLVYYTSICMIDLNRIVVKENIKRYQVTEKIDLHYLNSLSYTGVLGLMDLYEEDQYIDGLATILKERKQEAMVETYPWQSFNLKREQAFEKLKELNLD